LSKAISKKIAFLDRDGIINVDHGYVHKASDLQFVDGFQDLIVRLVKNHFEPVVVTNQSGVARGYFSMEMVNRFHEHLRVTLENDTGVNLTKFYVCPHHPTGMESKYSISCKCRKPKTGLIDAFEKQYDRQIDYEKSILIGDKINDIDLAIAKNLKSFQLDTKQYDLHPKADHIVSSLREVIQILNLI